MLLKPRIIVDDKIAYTRIPRYLGKGICSECIYNSIDAGKNDCRYVKLKRGTTLMTYCDNSIVHEIRWRRESNWNYVITEER